MVDSIECFTQIYEYAKDMIFLFSALLYDFDGVVHSMTSGVAFPEAKLVLVKDVVGQCKVIYAAVYNLFEYFTKYWQGGYRPVISYFFCIAFFEYRSYFSFFKYVWKYTVHHEVVEVKCEYMTGYVCRFFDYSNWDVT